jgi:hypothetical protein
MDSSLLSTPSTNGVHPSSKSGLTGTPRSPPSPQILIPIGAPSFVEDLSVAKEADYAICGWLTESAVDELMAAGKYGELGEFIKNMYEPS